MIRRGIGVQSFVSAGGGGIIPLLDVYGSAAVAYSVRKLRTLYTGNAIRVRRSSDNTEQDIGFDGNGNLDISALTTFVGANNGFVTTWYDQSGNGRDVTQTTAANQPQIITSGIVEKTNNKPSIKYNDNTDLLRRTSTSDTSTANTMSTVSKFNTISGYKAIFSIGNTNSQCYTHVGATSPQSRGLYTGSSMPISYDGNTTTNQEILSTSSATNLRKMWVNSVSTTITNNTTSITSNLNDILVGNDIYGTWINGNIQEAIFWQITQSDADIVLIAANQNFYFNVY